MKLRQRLQGRLKQRSMMKSLYMESVGASILVSHSLLIATVTGDAVVARLKK